MLKFGGAGFLFGLLALAVHRQLCNPVPRTARRRQQIRRTTRGNTWREWLARISSDQSTLDYEEKRALVMEQQDVLDEAMEGDMRQLTRSAGIVAAEEGRGYYGGDEEVQPPAYEDNDGSDMSSVVADGLRYTPGDYTPGNSDTSSIHSVLGRDNKQ